jgi:hypothetical protein
MMVEDIIRQVQKMGEARNTRHRLFMGVDLWAWVNGTIKKVESQKYYGPDAWEKAWQETYFELGGRSEYSGSKGCPQKGAYTLYLLGRIKGTKRKYLQWDYRQILDVSKNGVYAVMAIDILKETPNIPLSKLIDKIKEKYDEEFGEIPSPDPGAPTIAYKLFKLNKLITEK